MKAVPTATIASAIGIDVGDERPEHDQQHDQRREQAEQLLRALLDRRELGVAVELDDDARRLDRLAHRVLHRDDLVSVLRLDDVVELRLGVGDAPVLGERVLVERVADALDADRLARSARTPRSWSFAIASSIAALCSGVSRRSPSGAAKTRFRTRALLGGELRLDQVGRTLRVRARDLELVLQAAADGRNEHDRARR